MRKALVVGIDYYSSVSSLSGCVNDAHSVKSILGRHADGSINFDVEIFSCSGPADLLSRQQLKDSVRRLFTGDTDISLFYFAGHGFIESTGGYLMTSECSPGDGFSLAELIIIANQSRAKNKIIILDSCYSGIAGSLSGSDGRIVEIGEGMTILTASTDDQYALEQEGSGVFTSLFIDALSGAACNLLGDITPGSVYAHIDQSLGTWEQRPVFKTNVERFVSLRRVQPPIDTSNLRRIVEFFPNAGAEFQLNPSFEPQLKGRDADMPSPDPENVRTFEILQKMNRLNLVVPVDVPHMWDAAMQSKSCRLTVLGEHYRKLVAKNRI
jgi:hypothetical protein